MFKSILLPIDLNEESSWRRALPAALEHCRAQGASLHIVTVVPTFGLAMVSQFFPESYEERILEHTDKELHAFVRAHVPADMEAQTIVTAGSVYEEILRVATELNCDLIVMASHRPKLRDYLLGPNAARVVRHATCSVLVVRGD